MTQIITKAKKLARSLRRENRVLSWQKIAERYDSPLIKAGTLHRIATSLKHEGAQWYPASQELQIAYGLITPRTPRIPRRLEDLTTEELTARRARLVKQITRIQGIIASRAS